MKLTSEQRRELERLIASGNKVEAVKQFRNIADVGLTEATAAINAMQAGVAGPAARAINPKGFREAEAAAMAAIREGKVIEAIQRYRQHTKLGLKEAKQAVDALSIVHRSDGRVNAKLAATLMSMMAAGRKQDALTHLMSNVGYDEAEASALLRTIGRAGPDSAAGCLRILVGLGVLIALWLVLRQAGLL